MGLVDFDLGKIISGVGNIADDLLTSDEERSKMALDEKALDYSHMEKELEAKVSLLQGQLEINKEEAKGNWFQSSWRPGIGYICALSLSYQFLLYPILVWCWFLLQSKGLIPIELEHPPRLDTSELTPILMGMLGLGMMRSYDKKGGVDTKN